MGRGEGSVIFKNNFLHRRLSKMYAAAGAALSFAVAAGMVCGYTASATADMQRSSSPVRPDTDQIAWIGSIAALGAVLGGILAAFFCNVIGRKGTLMVSSVPFIVGWGFIAYANHLMYLYIGRFITGICVGLICVTVPPYLVEISTPKVRGMLGASFQLFLVTGLLLVNIFGMYLSWEWLAIPSVILVIVALGFMCFIPESPRWLIANGSFQEAVASIQFLHGDTVDASTECMTINSDLELHPKGSITWKEIKNPEVIIPALLSFSLVFFQQLTGNNAVLFYTVDIFKTANNSVDPNSSTVIVDAVLVIATAISSVLMDKVGRKILLIISGMGMAVCLFGLGTYDYISMTNSTIKDNYGWIPLLCLMVYIAAFSIGYGPITPLMMAEMTSIRSRSLICGAATALCWFFAFVVTKTFHALEISIYDYGVYYLYACIAVSSSIFAYFCLPETKGKPIEEIQLYFSSFRTSSENQISINEMTSP